MVNVIMWTALIGVGLCAAVFATLFGYIFFDMYKSRKNDKQREVLPPPERQAQRVYGQQYFEKAMKKG